MVEPFLHFSAANHGNECPCCKGSHDQQLWFVSKGSAGRYVVKNFSKRCKGITIYSTSPPNLLDALVLPDEAVEAAEDADSQLLPSLLQHLPNIAATPWVIYYAVACACVNERAPFEVFRAWAEQSPKYDAEHANRLFHGLRRNHEGYAIGTLQTLVRKACPKFFRVANARYIRQCMEPAVDLQALGVAVEEYSERFLRPLKADYKHIFVRSGCGTGKSQCCKELMQQVKPRSVLILAPRQLFARSMMHFQNVLPGLRVYSDLRHAERKAHPYLICQMESLWSVAEHYDSIIIDESESCLYQLSSSTVKKFEAVTEAFERAVRSSSLCIWADAFLSDRTLVVARQLDPGTSALLVHNTHVSDKRQAHCVGRYKEAKPTLLAAATAVAALGKRNVVVSSSKELAYEIGAALGWPYQRGEAAPTHPEGPCLLLTGDTSDATKTLIEDVKGLLDGRAPEEQPYQHFVYTSALTVGVNYDTENRFDDLFLYSSAASACVRDLMQSLKRVRHISENTLYYSTYPRYFGDKHFDIFSRERLMRIIENQEDYLCNNKLLSISGRMQPWMKNLWVLNTQEDNVSAFMHEDLLQAYLKATGYTVGQSLVEDADMRECLPTDPPAYEQIDDVDEVGFYLLTDHLERGQASSKDKLIWMKAHFQRRILRDWTAVDADTCSRMFSVWSADQLGIRTRLRNLSTEHCIATGGTWEQAGTPIFQDNKKQKLDAVRDIMALLNLSASYAIGEALTEAVLEQSAEKVLAMRRDLQETFRLRFREDSASKKSKKCRALEVVNQVLGRWGFTQIRLGSRKKKTIEGKRCNTDSTYNLVESTRVYEGFIKHGSWFNPRITPQDSWQGS